MYNKYIEKILNLVILNKENFNFIRYNNINVFENNIFLIYPRILPQYLAAILDNLDKFRIYSLRKTSTDGSTEVKFIATEE